MYFSDTYLQAKAVFLDTAQQAHLSCFNIDHPVAFDNEPLTTSVALSSSSLYPQNLLVLISGTHGVEGFCGSAIQNMFIKTWLKDWHSKDWPSKDWPSDVLFIHALNPYGFHALRRVNEDNIDLNRNFIDFNNSIPLFTTPAYQKDLSDYQELYPHLCPHEWRDASDLRLLEYRKKWGMRKLQKIISQGQYHVPQGLFYGGEAPSWSRKNLEHIIAKYIISKTYQNIFVLDLHTGLGHFGQPELISSHPTDSKSHQIASTLFPTYLTSLALDNSNSAQLYGTIPLYLAHTIKQDNLIVLTLEFGTFPEIEVLQALRYENYYHHHAPTHPKALTYKHQLKQAFYPNTPEWNQDVINYSNEIFARIRTYFK